MKHNVIAALTAMCVLLANWANADGKMIMLNFYNSPLFMVIELYEDLTATTVTVEKARYPTVTLKPDIRLSVSEAIDLIESHCGSIGIMFTKTNGTITVAPDESKMPENAFRSMYSPPTTLNNPTNVTTRPRFSIERSGDRQFTPEEMQKHLDAYQKAVEKAGLPPLQERDTKKEQIEQ